MDDSNNIYIKLYTNLTIRVNRALIDLLEPRTGEMYFIPRISPNKLVLTRSDSKTNSTITLNARTCLIAARLFTQELLDNGFETSVRYLIELSGDTRRMVVRSDNMAPDQESQRFGIADRRAPRLTATEQELADMGVLVRDINADREARTSRIFEMLSAKRKQDAEEARTRTVPSTS